MGKILDAFSDEQLLVNAVTEKRSPKHQHFVDLAHRFRTKLEEQLNDEQKKLLEKLLDVMESESYCDSNSKFVRGYSLGVLMAMEVMEERDKFLIEDKE